MLINTQAVKGAHSYENSPWNFTGVKINLQLEYIPSKHQQNILRHKNMKKKRQWHKETPGMNSCKRNPPTSACNCSHTHPYFLWPLITSAGEYYKYVSFKYTSPIWGTKELFWFTYICKEDEVEFQMLQSWLLIVVP